MITFFTARLLCIQQPGLHSRGRGQLVTRLLKGRGGAGRGSAAQGVLGKDTDPLGRAAPGGAGLTGNTPVDAWEHRERARLFSAEWNTLKPQEWCSLEVRSRALYFCIPDPRPGPSRACAAWAGPRRRAVHSNSRYRGPAALPRARRGLRGAWRWFTWFAGKPGIQVGGCVGELCWRRAGTALCPWTAAESRSPQCPRATLGSSLIAMATNGGTAGGDELLILL